jgi:membrane fusion protein (multidrug efflux system)
MNDLTTARQFEADPKPLAPRTIDASEFESPPHHVFLRSARRALVVCGAIVLIAGASGFGWHYWTVARFEQSTDDAYVKADSTIVAPKVAGYLRSVFVSDNQRVKAGDLLAEIDDRDFLVAVEQARADIAAAKADVDNISAMIERQGAVVAQAKATVGIDQANLRFAEQDNNRYTTLARQGAGSIQRAQQATSTSDSARATLGGAERRGKADVRPAGAIGEGESQPGAQSRRLASGGAQFELHDNQGPG